MDLKIFWTDTARNNLEQIHDYYKITTKIKVAKHITNQIFDKILILEKQPLAGQSEPILIHKKHKYRYLVQGNYKIIYWIEDYYIKIAAIFDCRQNPNKIKRIK